MHYLEAYHKHGINSPQSEYESKCKVLEATEYGFLCEGVLHEEMRVIVDEDIRGAVSVDVGKWYKFEGELRDLGDWEFELEVDSADNFELIGDRINDWISDSLHHRLEQIPSGGSKGGFMAQSLKYGGSQAQSGSRAAKGLGQSMSSASASQLSAGQTHAANFAGKDASPTSHDIGGFATGGGKDVDSFRKNIRNNLFPLPESLSTEGLFYDYAFDVPSRDKDKLFYPNYSQAVSVDPISGDEEHFLAVGLDSGIESFERPPLDLMVVLDISGSMDSTLSSYYYDENGRRVEPESMNVSEVVDELETEEVTKMEAACEVLKGIVNNLNDEDRFGVTVYDTQADVVKPLRVKSESDIDAIMEGIDEITHAGGTDMEKGFEVGLKEMEEFADVESMDRESRIFFLTDAMPNSGSTSVDALTELFSDAAEKNVHTTFVGIGIDANAELIDSLSSIKGANHYFVDSVDEFKERLNEEFVYAVTPLVFDLKLTVEGDGFEISDVYGNPNSDGDESTVMNVKTLFPSTGDEGTKGGIILLKISDYTVGSEVRLSTSWEERDGTKGGDVTRIKIPSEEPEFFDSEAIRKAVLLSRYSSVLRNWVETGRDRKSDVEEESGGRDIGPRDWERGSVRVSLTDEERERIKSLKSYFESECEEIGDESLEREIEMLECILDN